MTKGLKCFFASILFFAALCLNASAAAFDGWHVNIEYYYTKIADYEEYQRAVSERALGEDFVTYDEIAALGAFQNFYVGTPFWDENTIKNLNHGVSKYFYTLKDANGFIFHVDVSTYAPYCSDQQSDMLENDSIIICPPNVNDPYVLLEEDIDITPKGLCLFELLDGTALEDMRQIPDEWFENPEGNNRPLYYHGTLGEGMNDTVYQYDAEGKLESILFKFSRFAIKIHGSENAPLSTYPEDAKNTMLSRLLLPEGAAKANDCLRHSIEGTAPAELPAVCALIGAIIAGFGTWLVTYLVMRKRRGVGALAAAATAPVDAVADTPTDIPTDITPPES